MSEDLHDALYGAPWMFPRGGVITNSEGDEYFVLEYALILTTNEPAYVCSGYYGKDSGLIWVRPRSEVEDGRFTPCGDLFMKRRDAPKTVDALIQLAYDEVLDSLQDMVMQHCADHRSDEVDAGYISANADAIRLLARAGRIKLTHDGFGRSVCGVLVPRD